MGFIDDIKDAADQMFDLAGETVTYTTCNDELQVTAIFRGLTPDDIMSEHLMADVIICQLREWQLRELLLEADPQRGDTITRDLSLVTEQVLEQVLEVVDRRRDPSGIWELTCQQRIRVTP